MKKGVIVLLNLLSFAGGGALAYHFTKKHYQNKIIEACDATSKRLEKYYNSEDRLKEKNEVPVGKEKTAEPKKEDVKPSTETVTSIVENFEDESKYYDYGKPYRTQTVEAAVKAEEEALKKRNVNNPYVISPEEFLNSTFSTQTLYYDSDRGIVTDASGNVIIDKDYEKLIGYDALKAIGTYEADCVHVRNEKLTIDYEIILKTMGPTDFVLPEN